MYLVCTLYTHTDRLHIDNILTRTLQHMYNNCKLRVMISNDIDKGPLCMIEFRKIFFSEEILYN